MLGTYALSAGYYDAYYLKAQKVRTLLTRDFDEAFRKVDAIVTPTSPTAAFRLGEKADDPLAMYLADIYTVTADLAGIPGISVPCGRRKTNCRSGCRFWASISTRHDPASGACVRDKPCSGCALNPRLAGNSFPPRKRGKELSFATNFSAEVDSFAACLAHNRSPLYPGNSSGGKIDLHPLRGEQIVISHFAIGQHLLLILILDLGMHFAGQRFR